MTLHIPSGGTTVADRFVYGTIHQEPGPGASDPGGGHRRQDQHAAHLRGPVSGAPAVGHHTALLAVCRPTVPNSRGETPSDTDSDSDLR